MRRSLALILMLTSSAFADPRADKHGDSLPEGVIFRLGTVRDRIGSVWNVRSSALSPDGKTLAVEIHDGITLWDVETGRPVKRFATPAGSGEFPEYALQYSADGKAIARLGDRVVSVLDAATGKERFSRDLKKPGARQMSFVGGPDRLVVTVDEDAQVLFLDAETGRTVKTFASEASIWSLCPSGRYFLGWSQEVPMVPHLVDAKTGKVRARFPDAKRDIAYGDFFLSPDDSRFYVGERNGRLRTFDAETGKKLEDLSPLAGFNDDGQGVRLSLSPDATTAYLALRGHPTQRRDLKARKWLDPLPRAFGGRVLHLPDGKRVLQIGEDGVLRLYDLATRKQLPQTPGYEGCLYVHASPNGKRFALTSEDSTGARIDVFDSAAQLISTVHPGAEPRRFFNAPAARPFWSGDGRRFVCDGEKQITVLDPATGKVERAITSEAKDDEFSDVFLSAGGKRLVVVINGGQSVATYDLNTGKRMSLAHPECSGYADLSPDGNTLVLEVERRGLVLFDLAAGRVRADGIDPPPPDGRVACGRPVFSPGGSYLLSWQAVVRKSSSAQPAAAVLRDPNTLESKRRFDIGLSDDYTFGFSPDDQWLAVGDDRGHLHLWDVATGEKIGTWGGHRDRITGVAFLGLRRVVTSSNDLTALVWELRPKDKPKAAALDALSGTAAAEAYRAVWALAADPKGPEAVRGKFAPAKPPAQDQMRRWIADLGAEKFAAREAAAKALTELGRLAEPELQAAKAKTASAEIRARADAILARLPRARSDAETVQVRAVAAMELAGTEDAKKVLNEWAAGAPGARLTIDAKAALARLAATR